MSILSLIVAACRRLRKGSAGRSFDFKLVGVPQLAKEWHCTTQHIFNLIEEGQLPGAVDLRGKAATKTMIRVPRASVVEFLNRRKVRP